MAILIKIDDPLAELIRLMGYAERSAETGNTKKDQSFHKGRVDGLREALETIDLYLRGQREDCAVPLRSARTIIEEVKAINEVKAAQNDETA